jgi:hypothetical protein
MDDKPAEAVVLWEQYLPLALVLGLAREAMDDLYIEPPSFLEYGRAGWRGRLAQLRLSQNRLPDGNEAVAYSTFRHGHDDSLPQARISHGRNGDTLYFRPPLAGLSTGTDWGRRHIGRGTLGKAAFVLDTLPFLLLSLGPVVLAVWMVK